MLVVAPAAGCPLVGGRSARPEVAAGAEPQAAVGAAPRPLVAGGRPAGPLGPWFVSGAAPRLRRRRLRAAVVRAQREGLPTLVLD